MAVRPGNTPQDRTNVRRRARKQFRRLQPVPVPGQRRVASAKIIFRSELISQRKTQPKPEHPCSLPLFPSRGWHRLLYSGCVVGVFSMFPTFNEGIAMFNVRKLFSKRIASPRTPCRKLRATFRPRLEALEDRLVLSSPPAGGSLALFWTRIRKHQRIHGYKLGQVYPRLRHASRKRPRE